MDKWWKFVLVVSAICGGAVYITMVAFGLIFLRTMLSMIDVLVVLVWLVLIYAFFNRMYIDFYDQE